MAAQSGIAGVTVEIDGTPMTFTFDFAAMLRFEQRYRATLGKTSFEVLIAMEEGKTGMQEMVGLTWAGLAGAHPEVTEDQAARFLQAAMGKVQAAIVDSLPDADDVDADAATGENPRTAAAR